MAELTSRDRLQPSLLDRLTDEEPDNRQETRDRRVLSMRALRQSVRRDLAWLMNACSHAAPHELNRFPYVASSVVNFGFPDIVGHTASGLDNGQLEKILRDVIWAFEPRILRQTVVVKAVHVEETTGRHNTVAFIIEGDLWAQPFPERLYFRTELDLEAGEVSVVEQGAR